jgi:hypothetical protein
MPDHAARAGLLALFAGAIWRGIDLTCRTFVPQ